MELKNLNFSYALGMLKDGKKLTRKGWNDKGIWVSVFKAYTHTRVAIQDHEGNIHPMLIIRNVDGSFATWIPSITDLFAEDWEVIEPAKQYDKQAIEKAKKWFSDNDIDVDLMVSCGAVTVEAMIAMYEKEVLDK